MLRVAVRAILFAIVTVALWTVARPAYAMPAPFCDDRGATAMAQAPTLEASDVAVRRAHLPTTCAGEERMTGAAVAPGHSRSITPSVQAEPAVPVSPTFLAPLEGALLDVPPTVTPVAEGVVLPLERPPRA